MRLPVNSPLARRLLALASLFVLVFNACSFSLLDIPALQPATSTPGVPPAPTPTLQPSAAVSFTVSLPSPLLAGEELALSVVDEVSGLGLNPTNYSMQGMDTLHYTATLPFPLGSVVKYRYVRQSSLPILEDDSAGRPVRYRLYHASAPGSVQDIISSWTDSLFAAPSGRITGKVL